MTSVAKYDMGLRPDWPEGWPEQMVALEDYEALVEALRTIEIMSPDESAKVEAHAALDRSPGEEP